jgi:dihydrofolate synthase/folylpolyglutamate synthase
MLEEFFPKRRTRIAPGAHRLTQLLQHPDGQAALKIPCVLIVGTNGKGTTARYLESEFLRRDLSVGTYMSPHYKDPLERFRLNGQTVKPQLVEAARDRVCLWAAEWLPDASFFEITTAIALLIYQSAGVDILIAEAGLGGRFDSTNALAPLCTVLTSVGLDHMDRLGNTLAEIAFDKAHASRRGRTLICGPLSTEARQGVMEAVQRTGAFPQFSELNTDDHSHSRTTPSQSRASTTVFDANRDTAARTVLELERLVAANPHSTWTRTKAGKRWIESCTPSAGDRKVRMEAIVRRLSDVRLPGRFDVRTVRGKTLILDNAHNPAAAHALAQLYRQTFSQPAWLLFGSLNDKQFEDNLGPLVPQCSRVFLSTFAHESSVSADGFSALLARHQGVWAKHHGTEACVLTLADALELIFSTDAPNPVLATGSFAFVGAVMEELRLNPEPDCERHE